MNYARCYVELVELLRARKVELGLSDEFIEAQCLMAAGSCTKYLGRAPVKNLTASKLGDVMAVLACRLRLEPDPEQEVRMRPRWERRDNSRVHPSNRRISQAVMEIARPLVLEAMRSAGGRKRAACLLSKQRAAIARKAARTRWRLAKLRARSAKLGENAK
jgi:hypothetical protein